MENHLTRNNCFNFVRIIAALQVMFGHIVEHLELPIIDRLFKATYFLRGVPIFFAVSGFLMWFSMGRSRSYGQYLKKRFWRIYPELWIAVFIEITTMIFLYHGWNLKDLVLFIITQSTIFQFWTPDSLRGYGVGTPNGALWTIGVMIQYYLFAWFFYRLMRNRKPIIWAVGLMISFAISWSIEYTIHIVIGNEMIEKLYDQTFIKYFWIFLIGMIVAEFQDVILPVLRNHWYVFLIVALFFFITGWDLFSGYYFFWTLFLVAGLIGFAYRFPRLLINPDISYGIFLYHMTVVNVFVNFGWTKKWSFVILILIFTMFLAFLSTITIGKISKNKKNSYTQ